MSARYLLPCSSCSESIPVAPSQAGGSVACPSCGAATEAPRLGELRGLPLEPTDETKAAPGWGFRQGVLTTGLILAAALGAGAGWLAANEPPPPAVFDAARREAFVEQNIEAMSPKQLWELHNNYYLPMAKTGFQEYEDPRGKRQEEAIGVSQIYQSILGYAALGVLAVSALAFALLPK